LHEQYISETWVLYGLLGMLLPQHLCNVLLVGWGAAALVVLQHLCHNSRSCCHPLNSSTPHAECSQVEPMAVEVFCR
jgi:hypothetical protein